MIQTTLTLLETILSSPGQVSGRIACPPGLSPSPGQYLFAHAPDLNEPLPAALFASRIQPGELILAPPLPATWSAGLTLTIRGPLGTGFQLPVIARRVALVALGGLPDCLLPLVDLAILQDAAVALYTAILPCNLPAEVEILPLDQLPEARTWADYLAVDLTLARLPELPALLGLQAFDRVAFPAQVLLHTAMPCGGVGGCGVCAVPTRHQWKLACKDGPVFDLDRLLSDK